MISSIVFYLTFTFAFHTWCAIFFITKLLTLSIEILCVLCFFFVSSLGYNERQRDNNNSGYGSQEFNGLNWQFLFYRKYIWLISENQQYGYNNRYNNSNRGYRGGYRSGGNRSNNNYMNSNSNEYYEETSDNTNEQMATKKSQQSFNRNGYDTGVNGNGTGDGNNTEPKPQRPPKQSASNGTQ